MKPTLETLQLLPDESFRLLRWNVRDVTAVEAIGSDGKTYPFKGAGDVWHYHPGFELVLVMRGSGTRCVGDNIASFNAIDLVLLGANLPHCWYATGPLAGYALQFDCGPEHALGQLPEIQELHTLWSEAQRGLQFTGKLAGCAAELILSLLRRGSVGRLAVFLQILDKLQHATSGEHSLLSQKAVPALENQAASRGIQQVINRILQSFHQDLNLADVLKDSGMSRATFTRQFKHHTGKNFIRFLTEVRIASVCRQLIETERSIGEIAFASGFNNLSHFNHQFAIIQGEAPGAFRDRMKRRGLTGF